MSQNQKKSLGSDNLNYLPIQTNNPAKNMTNSGLNSTNSALNSTNFKNSTNFSNTNLTNLNSSNLSMQFNDLTKPMKNELMDFVDNRSLDLRWQTKNRIVNHLVSHTKLLYKNINQIDNDEISDIIDEGYLIFKILMDLPKASDKLKGEKSTDPLNRFKRIKLEKDEEKSDKITEKLDNNMDKQKEDNNVKKGECKLDDDEIILDLSWSVRDLLVNHLLINHHISILYSHEIPRSIKKLLIQENNDLINTLTKLAVRNEDADLDESTDEATLVHKIPIKRDISTTNQSVYEIKEDLKKELLQEINAELKKN